MRSARLIFPVVFLWASGPAQAGIHQVWDEGHAFKADTVLQVDQLLDEIHDRFHKDLMIETFASIPDDLKARFQSEDKEKFFENWSMAEGGQLKLNGIVILIVREPRHIYVGIGFATRQKAFTFADRAELLEAMTPLFRENEFDKGILVTVNFVRDRIEKNLSAPAPATRPATPDQAASTQKSK